MKAFTDAIRLGMTRLGFRVVNIFNGQIELVFMVLDRAIVFRTPISQYPQQADRLRRQE